MTDDRFPFPECADCSNKRDSDSEGGAWDRTPGCAVFTDANLWRRKHPGPDGKCRARETA